MGSETSSHAFRGSAREGSSTQGHRGRRRAGQADGHIAALSSDVRLTLPAQPENVAVIRHMLGAFAEALRLPADLVADMRLAVTEACTNVVRHAYDDPAHGTIDVVIRPSGDRLDLIVSDHGSGMGPSSDSSGPGLGLPMITALADHVEIAGGHTQGSRLSMSFRCRPRLGAS
jgi:anti-sigma regulatory factor (Ser/Thr protein kinase)